MLFVENISDVSIAIDSGIKNGFLTVRLEIHDDGNVMYDKLNNNYSLYRNELKMQNFIDGDCYVVYWRMCTHNEVINDGYIWIVQYLVYNINRKILLMKLEDIEFEENDG